MHKVSIITAAYAPSAAYLGETISGVEEQQLPQGWEMEWIVQEDGNAPSLAHRFAQNKYTKYQANGAQLGIAATRNLALSRAAGDLIQVLDSDDVLLPGALFSLITKFESEKIHWAVGQADDLMPDTSRISWESALEYGLVKPGTVNEWAESHGGNWPIHCAGLMLRTSALHAVGGWVGLPGDEDTAMFSALSELSSGYNLEKVTWLYRQHPQQITRSSRTRHLSDECRKFALQRIKAVKAMNMKFDSSTAYVLDLDLRTVEVGPPAKEPQPLDRTS